MQLNPILAKQTLLSIESEKRESVLDVARRVEEDQLEIWALFCALMAWGRIKVKMQILSNFIEKINFDFLSFIQNPSIEKLRIIYPNKPEKLAYLCHVINELIEEYGSIGKLVKKESNVKSAIFRLAFEIGSRYKRISRRKFPSLPFLKSPEPPRSIREKRKTSALKRYCMYFRWMIRDEFPDFGLWKFFDKSYLGCDATLLIGASKLYTMMCHDRYLFYPLDIHVTRILYRWNVLPDTQANWLNVEVATEYFKEVLQEDPLRLDYHLVTFGQKICTKNPKCKNCLIFRSGFKCKLR